MKITMIRAAMAVALPYLFSTIRLTEDSPYEAGVPTVTTTQTYSYKRGQLAGFTTVQSYSVQNETVKIENTTSVTYEEHQAIATDNFGNVSTYLLNDKGYAIQCTRQEVGETRTYGFFYFTSPEGKPYLKNITESINGKSLCVYRHRLQQSPSITHCAKSGHLHADIHRHHSGRQQHNQPI